MLLLRLPGVFLLRFAERQFLALLFQLPPRLTRFSPDRGPSLYSADLNYCKSNIHSGLRQPAQTKEI